MFGKRWEQSLEERRKKKHDVEKRHDNYKIIIILTILVVVLVWAVYHGGWAYAWELLHYIWWDDR